MKVRVFETEVEPFAMITVAVIVWVFFTVVAVICIVAVVLAVAWRVFNLPARALALIKRRWLQ